MIVSNFGNQKNVVETKKRFSDSVEIVLKCQKTLTKKVILISTFSMILAQNVDKQQEVNMSCVFILQCDKTIWQCVKFKFSAEILREHY